MPATVLCIHEDRNVARIHTEMLEAEGYEVVCAFDGRQSLEIARTRPPDFTVIDAYLPRQDGFEILAEMRRLEVCRATPVLILSAGELSPTEASTAAGEVIEAFANFVAGSNPISRYSGSVSLLMHGFGASPSPDGRGTPAVGPLASGRASQVQ